MGAHCQHSASGRCVHGRTVLQHQTGRSPALNPPEFSTSLPGDHFPSVPVTSGLCDEGCPDAHGLVVKRLEGSMAYFCRAQLSAIFSTVMESPTTKLLCTTPQGRLSGVRRCRWRQRPPWCSWRQGRWLPAVRSSRAGGAAADSPPGAPVTRLPCTCLPGVSCWRARQWRRRVPLLKPDERSHFSTFACFNMQDQLCPRLTHCRVGFEGCCYIVGWQGNGVVAPGSQGFSSQVLHLRYC